MKIYEEYYGKAINKSWVSHNLLDGWFIYKRESYNSPDIVILAAFDDKAESFEFSKTLPRGNGIIGFFRSDYSNPDDEPIPQRIVRKTNIIEINSMEELRKKYGD